MSPNDVCKVLHKFFLAELEQNIAASTAGALRQDFPNIKAAATAIALQVETNMETIKKWYYGFNAPSAANLIVLARISPSVRQTLLKLIDGND